MTEQMNHDIPKNSSEKIVKIIKNACQRHNYPFNQMVSGAFHDAMFVSEFAPMGMIFVPSKGGISHNPQEWTEYEDIAKGVNILADSLVQLANS